MSRSEFAKETAALGREMKIRIKILAALVAIMWILEILDLLFLRGAMDYFGVRPRSLAGLLGIFFSPFLHGGIGHLASNTVSFLILGWFVMFDQIRDFFVTSLIAIIFSGLGIWLFGSPNSIHIGASGLIFGYLGFLLLRGFFQRSPGWIVVSLIVGLLYGGMIWGLLPLNPGVSWQGHLFGFIGGAVAARRYRGKRRRN